MRLRHTIEAEMQVDGVEDRYVLSDGLASIHGSYDLDADRLWRELLLLRDDLDELDPAGGNACQEKLPRITQQSPI